MLIQLYEDEPNVRIMLVALLGDGKDITLTLTDGARVVVRHAGVSLVQNALVGAVAGTPSVIQFTDIEQVDAYAAPAPSTPSQG